MHQILLILHILGASIWIGGHLYLAVCLLPSILRDKDVDKLLAFEGSYEWLGMSALVMQVVTGLAMMHDLLPQFNLWWQWDTMLGQLIALKLFWLLCTICTALSARFRVIPNLSVKTLPLMAVHIIAVTTFSLGFMVTGVWFRYGLPWMT